MTREPKYSFIFICQEGPLEIQAMLLAASLKRFLRCDHELVACLPEPENRWGRPAGQTLEFLDRLGVGLRTVRNEIDENYPQGNKVGCLGVEASGDKLVFLDTDILSMNPFRHEERFLTDFNAKPADELTFGREAGIWERVYRACGTEQPAERIRTTVGGEATLPYFNAGLVAVGRDCGLARAWLDCCQAIDADPEITDKRPWLDQVALPVAVHRLGLGIDYLEDRHNHPVHLKPLPLFNPPIFCHYHGPKVLVRFRRARQLVKDLAEAHPLLARSMAADETWAAFPGVGDRRPGWSSSFRRIPGPLGRNGARLMETWHQQQTPAEDARRNVLVTGIPRSGTSLLSALLNSVDNVVCLNEVNPTEELHGFFRHTRRAINAGEPVANKFAGGGGLTTNTLDPGTELREAKLEVADHRFVLGQKYTLPYLNRLEKLLDQGWCIWAVVRHPLYAISSWKRCPQQFAIANVNPPDPLLDHIPFSSPVPDRRRVEIWNHYAGLIHCHRDRLHLVRYEDLVNDPAAELKRFCAHFGIAAPVNGGSLVSRNRAESYTATEEGFPDLVHKECRLELFGYGSS